MADSAHLFKKDKEELSDNESILKLDNKIFIFIVILATTILVVDYVLVITFIDIIKNL